VIGKLVSGASAGKPVQALIREARLRSDSHRSLMQASYQRYTLAQVTEGLRHAAAVDRMIKGLIKGDVWDELLQLGLRFAKNARA